MIYSRRVAYIFRVTFYNSIIAELERLVIYLSGGVLVRSHADSDHHLLCTYLIASSTSTASIIMSESIHRRNTSTSILRTVPP